MTEESTVETTILPVVAPAMKPKEIIARFNEIQEVKKGLIDPETDVIKIANNEHVRKSGYRKYAFAFNLSDEIIREEKEVKRDEQGKEIEFIWRIQVRVTAPNGRTCTGIAACSSKERNFAHLEHDTYALCHTRAKNRAISDILGLGEVSAEEIGEENSSVPKQVGTPNESDDLNHNAEFTNKYTWKVKNAEYPLTIDSAPYGWFGKNVLKPFQEKHHIRIFEEVVNGYVVSLKFSKIEEEQKKHFMTALSWTIKKLANVQDQDFAIVTEEIK